VTYFPVENGEIYYEWVDRGRAVTHSGRSDRPILVFIHGWGGSARYWQATAQAMADDYDCLLYDLTGFGRSRLSNSRQDPANFPLAAYVEDLAQLLSELKIDRCSLISHSMGSSIAALFLGKYPEVIDRAVLTCGGIFEYDERAFRAFSQFGKVVVKVRPRWLTQIPGVDRLVMQRFLHRDLPASDRREFLEDYLMAEDAAALGTLLDAVNEGSAIALSQAYSSLKMPVLMLSGEFDKIIPPALGQAAASLNESIELVVMPDVGHLPMLEDPVDFLARVRSFLS
jgi:pimeloyl-ACP methyl ester carboxylesterase